MRIAVKMTMGLDVSKEEVLELREQPQSIEDDIRKKLKEELSQKTPEERAEFVKK